jgi:hypothetical protein
MSNLEPVRLNVTITLPIEIYNLDYDLSELDQYLEWHFSDWDEGRYPFDTEIAKHGLNMCIKNAVCQLVSQVEYDKYNGEYIESPGRKTAKGVVTSEEILKKLHVSIRDGIKFAVKEGNDDTTRT